MLHVSDLFITLCILLHVGFMILECFLWKSPFARKRFGMSESVAETTANLAFNQGIYNLFLAAGLIFAQFYRGEVNFQPTALFFLGCIIVAGITGAITVSRRILYIQAAPAVIAAVLLLMGL